jgi:hypothetical protein
MKQFIVALTLGLLAACATPELPPEPATASPTLIPLGEQHVLASAILGDTREINVWLPPGYSEGREIGAVIYVLDGAVDQDFPHIAGLGQLGALSWTYETFIIVGIQTKDRQHELTPAATDPRFVEGFPQSGGAPAFRRFLIEEVRPFVEARYRTGTRRALIGESLAGLFVVDTLRDSPGAFDDYIAISPSLWWDGGRYAAAAAGQRAAQDLSGRRLYMAMAGEGGAMAEGINNYRVALEAAPPAGFDFIFSDRSASETHSTIYHGEALAAFRRLYPLPPWEGESPWWMTLGAFPPPAAE